MQIAETSDFPMKVRMMLARHKLTYAAAGKALGVSGNAVNKWANGKSAPRSSELVKFARLVGCSLDFLFSPESVDFYYTVPKRANPGESN